MRDWEDGLIHCDQCECQIDENEEYFVIRREVYCTSCFQDWAEDHKEIASYEYDLSEE